MARSRNSQRRINNGRGRRFGNDVRARSDWQVGGGIVLSTAPTTVTAFSTWNNGQVLTAGAFGSIQAVTLPEAVTAVNAPPSVGELQVDEICGSLFFGPTFAAFVGGMFFIGVGIYISKFNTTTTSWVLRQPSVSTEAADDDWLFLRYMVTVIPAVASDTGDTTVEIPLGIAGSIILGRGEALHVAIENTAASAGPVYVTTAFRSRISSIT